MEKINGRNLYVECNMGAAGDMLMSALLELHENPEDFINRLNALKIPNVCIKKETVVQCGITGTHVRVFVDNEEENEHMHEHHHHHNHLHNIEHIVGHLDLSQKVKADVMAVYTIIAQAESQVHNCEIENIHFHEVGTMDAVADIVGVCMLMDELKIDKVSVSPINTGKGQVKCAHGLLPVPAPATALILKDMPIYNNEISGELCTPTGAALLKYFASEFGNMPAMSVDKIGYGFGTKKFDSPNCVRVFLGTAEDKTDKVAELMCNVDDMTGERIGFAMNRIFEAGAAEVFTTPVGMKKNRPGVLLTCICSEDNKENVVKAIFKYTTTIGIRENILNRYVLHRQEENVNTKYGNVRVKRSEGYGVVRTKAEYDDLEKIALENGLDVAEVEWE